MTCQVLVKAPDGSKMKVRALLHSASSASFVSERLVQNLGILRSRHEITISGVAGMTNSSQLRSIAPLDISPIYSHDNHLAVTAIVVPKVTCDYHFIPLFTSQAGLTSKVPH